MAEYTPGTLVLEDGSVYEGRSVGAQGEWVGEIVFNTSLTGYQEIITDPSYAGQVVVMTASHIGNYGVTGVDDQSEVPAVSGFVMRAIARRHSNWRAEGSLGDYLAAHGVAVRAGA
mgnify:CR=1 FL=1